MTDSAVSLADEQAEAIWERGRLARPGSNAGGGGRGGAPPRAPRRPPPPPPPPRSQANNGRTV